MSLYVFNVTPHTAVVTADTRQCSTVGGTIYHLNDTAEKLHIVDDAIVTAGGVEWICNCIINAWKDGVDHSVERLHRITLETLPHINELAAQLGLGQKDFLSNPYMLEFCILQYDIQLGCNVFYHIATSTGYQLERFDVDGVIHPYAKMFGGIDYEIVQEYFDAHPGQTKWDYIDAVHAAYELAVSEKVGGTLMIASQNRGQITMSQRKLKDNRPLREAMDLFVSASNIVGKNLTVSCPDVNGGVSKFQMDEMGFFQYNGRYYMAGDGDAGRIGMDSHWGIFGGPKALFDVTDTGYVKPSFVDDNGNMILDKDGFPKDTDFLLGMKGKHFFRGTIHAEAGKFKGVVQAEDFMLKSGDSMKSILSDKGKIMGDYIDARGINILDDDGDPVLYMDKTGIHWTPKYSPFKTQYSVSTNGPWHDKFDTNDEYRRDSVDGGTTWGPGIKYVAKDGLNGVNGSDATVNYNNILSALQKAASLSSAFMTVDALGAPSIYGGKIYGAEMFANKFNVFPLDEDGKADYSGSFNIHGHVIHTGPEELFHMFQIKYNGGGVGSPFVEIGSPQGAIVRPFNIWDFSDATVRGIPIRFGE